MTGDADGTSETSRFKFYRGPNGWATTDFMGYDCLKMGCPTGDNPRTRGTFVYICLFACVYVCIYVCVLCRVVLHFLQ